MSQVPVHGNLSHAMRDNYAEHGVDEYYRKVASSYRNPFFPGIKKVVWTFMTRWWLAEGKDLYGEVSGSLRILDMAAGSGEATICLQEWIQAGRSRASDPTTAQPKLERGSSSTPTLISTVPSGSGIGPGGRGPFIPPNARRAAQARTLFDMGPPDLPTSYNIDIVATDPYTSPAYSDRTSLTCHPLSFTDLANTLLPPSSKPDPNGLVYEIIICSFALHLITEPSELFALLYELSTKARWLVIIAPHKKPEIKDGWGWERWDLRSWDRAGEGVYGGKARVDDDGETETELEIVRDKVKLRLYKSTNVE